MASGEAVANEPRLFVGQVSSYQESCTPSSPAFKNVSGLSKMHVALRHPLLQIPAKCTEEDLWPLFSPYGRSLECQPTPSAFSVIIPL